MNEEANDLNDNEEIVNKNAYNNDDDDDFLSAPGGLLKDNNNNNNNNNKSVEYSNRTDDDIKQSQQQINGDNTYNDDDNNNNNNNNNIDIIKLDKPSSIGYGASDDTSDSSDDDIISDGHNINNNNKYNDERQDELNRNNTNNNTNNIDTSSSSPIINNRQYMILLNDKSFLNAPDSYFPDNYITTSKYTLLTFIPLNLFEQFRRIANIYFLIIIGIQLIPGVSPFPIGTSIMPLAFILCVGAIKDGIEDYDRHKSDRIANSTPILRLNPMTGQFNKTLSALLEPSDIILIKRHQQVPADCIVLGCDNSNGDNSGVCYINTSSMDGENAPKLRRAVRSTVNITNNNDLCKLKGYIKCPPNTKALHGFTGALSIKKNTLPSNHNININLKNNKKTRSEKTTIINKKENKINYGTMTEDEEEEDNNNNNMDINDDDDDDTYLAAQINKNMINTDCSSSNNKKKHRKKRNDMDENKISGLSDINFVFRGSKLVNTEYIHALVLFVGKETKLMLNRNQVPFKFSKFEKILNRMIGSILIFNFVLCVGFGIAANTVIEPYPELKRKNWISSFALDTCSWLILTSWMIPFSLYVTLELIKMIQAQWIAWDDKMTYNPEHIEIDNDENNNKTSSISSVDCCDDDNKNNNKNNKNNKKNKKNKIYKVDDGESMDHSWDQEYGGKIRHAKTKNSNLNEELGHIDYIFTDKTGTLTQNTMELSKCSVGGKKYSLHSISGDFISFSLLINQMIQYENKKYESFKLHSNNNNNNKQQTKQENNNNNILIKNINNDLNEQFERNNHEFLNKNNNNNNKQKQQQKHQQQQQQSILTQLQHDTHFLFNLLLCSSTLPSKKNKNKNMNNVPHSDALKLQDQTLVASTSKEELDEIKHNDTDITITDDNKKQSDKKEQDNELSETEIEFQSPSPDEVAFAEALCDHGIILEERQADGTIFIRLTHKNTGDLVIKFKVLAVLDFTARRKRMTVIVEDEMGSIHLYCKGADVTLFRLCNEESKTLIHLTKRHVTSFARGGSRTLVMGWKKLSILEYDEFDRYYREAEVALTDRNNLIENAFSFIEHSLYLLGCTAVEDQMQDGVPEAIYKLKDAKIKVIMLTGDKQETAVSIGRQSLIISNNILDSELMFLSQSKTNKKNGINREKEIRRIDKKLSGFIDKNIGSSSSSNNNINNNSINIDDDPLIDKQPALILSGDALEMCLCSGDELLSKFLLLFEFSSTIICARCAPSQKAMLVGMIRDKLDGVALAIGDGANDVSMIQSSNVGIGIMGKEGTQASLAADFVIHRFKHIQRLLFIHGRYSFLRTSLVSLISLYKNMAFMLTVCYYGFYSLYTAQSCFDPYLMSAFNLMFAALFPLCVGAFEQDISQKTCLNHPAAYYYFKINSFFNIKYFLFWMFTAFWQSLVWFLCAVNTYYDNLDIWQSDINTISKNGGLYVWGTQMFTTNVIVICLKMMMETKHWNWTYYVSTIAGFVIYTITLSILSNWLYFDYDMFYVMEFTYNSIINWLLLLIQCILCLFPGILYNLWKRERWASLATILYEAEKFGYLTKNGIHRPTNDIIQDYMRR